MLHATRRSKRFLVTTSAIAALGIGGTLGGIAAISIPTIASGAAPTSPPVTVCGNSALLNGPSSAPSGATTVPAGNDSSVTFAKANTTYWFAAGAHTLGTGQYNQIQAGTGSTYEGAPGAVVNGQGDNDFAFTGHASHVTVEYLTVTDFAAPSTQGVVNHTAATGWTVAHDTVETSTTGAGVEIGSTQKVTDDCLTHNRQYGFNAYSTTGAVHNVVMSDNEISFNDGTGTTPLGTTCGCTGGGKFWNTIDAQVTTNYVHTNGNVGLWMDTDNAGFLVQHNYIAHNYNAGLMYEISYNATVSDNTFVGDGIGQGPTNPGFPTSAVYISESGGDSRVASNYSGKFNITGNLFTNNYGGVVLWENSNRYCGDGSDGMCTLVTPSTYTITSCKAHLTGSSPTQSPDYYDNCRWKTKTVTVSGNTFNFTPKVVGSACTQANYCGFNALFSEYGSTTPWKAWVVPENISNNQHNVFTDNTYTGPWMFDGFNQGDEVSWTQWTKGFTDQNGSGDHFNGQDAGSTFNGTAAPSTTSSSGGTSSGTTTDPTTGTTTTTTTAPTKSGTTTTTTTSPPSKSGTTTTTTTSPPSKSGTTTTTTTTPPSTTHYTCAGTGSSKDGLTLRCHEGGTKASGSYSCSGTQSTSGSSFQLACRES